jgi:hypothetical protein
MMVHEVIKIPSHEMVDEAFETSSRAMIDGVIEVCSHDIADEVIEIASPRMAAALRDLQRIPGVGPSLAADLWDLGYSSVDELAGEDPDDMYFQHCMQRGTTVDRCVLYVFRCAVYFAENDQPDPELLKWWNWMDRRKQFPSGYIM